VQFEVDACIRRPAQPAPAATPAQGRLGEITFRRAGTLVPQDDLVELAARSKRTNKTFADVFRQLWLAQTPHYVLARHDAGMFTDVRHERLDTSPALLAAADAAQDGLKRLSMLLREVRRLVVQRGQETQLSLVCSGDGSLEVFVREQGAALPAELALKMVYLSGDLP
jgi:hypothetical protein